MDELELSGTYLIRDTNVIAGDDLELLERAFLVVRDGTIEAIGQGEPPDVPRSIRLPGRLLVPGFINCHTHIADGIVKDRAFGYPAETNILWQPDGLRHRWMTEFSREEIVGGIRDSALQMLSLGVVAFADFREGGYDGIAALREACAGLPIEAIALARHNRWPLHTEQELQANRTPIPADLVAEMERSLDIADGFSVVWANETTDPGLRQAAQLVRSFGKILATHACETARYRDISMAHTGRGDVDRVLEHLQPDFVVHMTASTPDELNRVIEAGIPIAMCPRGMAALGNGFVPFGDAKRSGATIGLGTDNVMINSPDILAEMDFLTRTERGLSRDPAANANDVLASGTIDAARTLGIADRLGSLRVGKSATAIVFDLDSPNLRHSSDPVASLVERANGLDIEAVIVGGELAHGTLSARA